MLRALKLLLAAYSAPFRHWRAFLKIYWPVLLPVMLIAYSLSDFGGDSAATAPPQEVANAPAADPVTPSTPTPPSADPAAPPAATPPSAATPPAADPASPNTATPPSAEPATPASTPPSAATPQAAAPADPAPPPPPDAATPATTPPPGATPQAPATADPATSSPPDPAAAPSSQDQTLSSILLLAGIATFVPLLARSTFLWHRKLILDEMPHGLLRGITGARSFFGRYILVGLAFLAILASIMGLALAYPYDIGLPVVGETPEAEMVVYFYIITVGCLLFAILCARFSRGLPRLAVMGEASAEGHISEASIWRAIELPFVIFLTSWPMLALWPLASNQALALATAYDIVAFTYFPAVFTAGLSLYYVEVVKRAAEPVSPY